MSRTKGGKPRPLTNLQLRQHAYDAANLRKDQGYKRPGSNSQHKQT